MSIVSIFQTMPRSWNGVKRKKVDSTSMERAMEGIIAGEISSSFTLSPPRISQRNAGIILCTTRAKLSNYYYLNKTNFFHVFAAFH